LIRQKGFGRGIGGTGDNIIVMPVIERDENKQVIQDNNNFCITYCVFDDFKSYLNFIEDKMPVRRSVSHHRTLPASVNGITQDDYILIWQRFQGLARE
jgi:hypothetical protein